MRIVSDFRDYYDGCQALGQDRSLVYVRKRQEIDLKWPGSDSRKYDLSRCGVDHDWVAIKFCGTIYHCAWLQNTNQSGSKKIYCYCVEDVDKFVRQNFPRDEDYEHYLNPPENRSRWPTGYSRSAFERTFANEPPNRWNDKRPWDYTDAKLFPIQEPVAVVDTIANRKMLFVNCQLKNYGFAKVKPPQIAYMEIESWLNNQARPLKPIPHISDEVMAQAKGFDKFSFRKDKSKR